jgi:chromosomal replication initiation ATPase DnaA
VTTDQLPLPFAHRPDYAAADLLAAPSNAEALAWLDRTAAWPAGRLALWGAAGCGKTHLLHLWARARRAVLLGAADLPGFALPPARPIALDQADAADEAALLHLLNSAAEAGWPVLLAARPPPARWPTRLADLASRLRATTAVQIAPAEDALLRPLLARLLSERQFAVPEPVQAWLLARLPRNPAALVDAAARLDRAGLAAGRAITRALAAEALRDLLTIDEVSATVGRDASCATARLRYSWTDEGEIAS